MGKSIDSAVLVFKVIRSQANKCTTAQVVLRHWDKSRIIPTAVKRASFDGPLKSVQTKFYNLSTQNKNHSVNLH